ncbi:uncharacterized protein P884DRAFT_202739 [Thermothelomyces heterothallicus CBS 202.75]|uniref:uncharacterized protein n=1 Tax=Thermothelomyces heterothallicus CBS 202.75 TaxID=1149848 RepID=UPI00374226E9
MRVSFQSVLLLGALSAQASAYASLGYQQQTFLRSPGLHVRTRFSRGEEPEDNAPPYRVPLLTLHRALVNVSSISDSEGEVGLLLERLLKDLNYTVELQPVPPSEAGEGPDDRPTRYNVLAWPGRNASRALDKRTIITSHIDVVPPYIPYAIDNETVPPSDVVDFAALPPTTLISGRGSVDAKASVAAQITATNALLSEGAISPDSVVLLYVVGEENSGSGMKHFSDSLSNTSAYPVRPQFRAAIFGEPTENKLACGHKGVTGGTVSAVGKAGHSGYPWLGKSAIHVLIRALDRLLEEDLGSSERYGNTTVNVGLIEGGVAANAIAPAATARVLARVAVGNQTTGGQIVAERIKKLIKDVDSEALQVNITSGVGPVQCECEVDGFETVVANYGTDIPNLKGNHVKYLYGPGSILVAHGDNEGLQIQDLEDSVEGYKRLIQHAVGSS